MDAVARKTDQALAVFAHELREPLASILFAVEAMTTATDDAGATREMCAVVERQSRYVARMVDDVLEVCRGNSGKTCLRKDWCDLSFVLTHAVETANPILRQRQHRLAVSLPTEPVHIMADALRVQQVVVNLLANAAKYTHPGGFIRLAVEVAGDLVVIEVRDNGVGIPATLLPRVFDLFRQGENSPGHGFAGLGIGLALVKSLVELHGGSVSAHSDGSGTGSAFVVRLPATSLKVHQTPNYPGGASNGSRTIRLPVSDAMADA